MSLRVGVTGCLFVLMVGTGCPSPGQDTEAGGSTRSGPAFSAQAAYAHVAKQVSFGPRVPGTEGHQQQLAWMVEYLRARADTVRVQRFVHTTSTGKRLALANVFARFKPAEPDRILLVAHWDTRSIADNDPDETKREQPVLGANDGGSGTAVLLEIANILANNDPPIGVDLLLVDGEDYSPGNMYLGARYFAANLPPGFKPLYGILVDMVGDRNPVFRVEGYSEQYAPEVVHRVWTLAQELGYGDVFIRSPAGDIQDDHVPLNEAGIRTIDIIDLDYPFWHTSEDVLSNTAADGLGAVGTVLVELIFRGG